MSTPNTLPSFRLPASGGGFVGDADLRGRPSILYFYPKDNTSGCTLEGQEFTRLYPRFVRAGVRLYGVSRDGVRSHERFAAKHGFPFPLLADEEETLCAAFDVIRPKTMYGKPVRGIERSTFVFDAEGRLVHEWRKVKAEGHAAEVLAFVERTWPAR
jgi:peroxiredoxin Q/BCP